ncbi:creatininase family protein [Paenibacillus sp. IITD108]|uniref:creatininase family protein n=1 Tax=Paenibacillus sp. IITD108 TaxID=3116649 RepID=UPI002F3E2412
MTKLDFGAYTREELKAFANGGYTVIIPLAATEQHGPHLPVYTDTMICERVCREAIIQAGSAAKLIMAPVLSIGCSGHHLEFGGTLSFSSSVYYQMLMDIGRSLHIGGFKQIIFLNGHGGNEWMMQQAAVDLTMQYSIWTASASYWNLAKQALMDIDAQRIGPVPGHAGAFETAMMMSLLPDLKADGLKKEHPSTISITKELTNVFAGRRGLITGYDGYTDAADGATKDMGDLFFAVIAKAVTEWLIQSTNHMQSMKDNDERE